MSTFVNRRAASHALNARHARPACRFSQDRLSSSFIGFYRLFRAPKADKSRVSPQHRLSSALLIIFAHPLGLSSASVAPRCRTARRDSRACVRPPDHPDSPVQTAARAEPKPGRAPCPRRARRSRSNLGEQKSGADLCSLYVLMRCRRVEFRNLLVVPARAHGYSGKVETVQTCRPREGGDPNGVSANRAFAAHARR